MSPSFSTLLATGTASSETVQPAQLRMVDRAASIIFDGDVVAQARGASPSTQHTWVLRVVDVVLTNLTRRPFVVQADIGLQAFNGSATARITVEGQTVSRQTRASNEPRAFNANLRLAIRRSTHPRERLRILIWVEASSSTTDGEAQATAEVVDIQAR